MMGDSFIPAADGLALTWIVAFSGGISTNAAMYALTVPSVATIAGAMNAYTAVYAVATNPAMRTEVTIANNDELRISTEVICH